VAPHSTPRLHHLAAAAVMCHVGGRRTPPRFEPRFQQLVVAAVVCHVGGAERRRAPPHDFSIWRPPPYCATSAAVERRQAPPHEFTNWQLPPPCATSAATNRCNTRLTPLPTSGRRRQGPRRRRGTPPRSAPRLQHLAAAAALCHVGGHRPLQLAPDTATELRTPPSCTTSAAAEHR